MTTFATLPTLSIAASGAWELLVPLSALPPGIANVTISAEGVYIERTDGDYDLVPWEDIVDVMVPARIPPSRIIASNGHNVAAWTLEDSPGVIPLQ